MGEGRARVARACAGIGAACFLMLANAACEARGAAAQNVVPPPLKSRENAVAGLYARSGAIPEAVREEVRGRVVKVADGDTITILSSVGSRVPRDRPTQ